MTEEDRLKQIVEAALLAAGRPLSLDQLQSLFPEQEEPEKKRLREVLAELIDDYQGRGVEVIEVGSGFRIQVRSEFSPWVSKLWSERPPKYSRALLETLALIAYRQPITRGEIEDVRGVTVSTNIIKTLTEREWVRVVGHRDVPGKPALYATTKEFLDYFNLKSLNELPTLAEIRDLESINRELELDDPDTQTEQGAAQRGQETDETTHAADSSDMDDALDTEDMSDTEDTSDTEDKSDREDTSDTGEMSGTEDRPDTTDEAGTPDTPDTPESDVRIEEIDSLEQEAMLPEEQISQADSEDESTPKTAAHESE
jgi:segregation and condensation protein B